MPRTRLETLTAIASCPTASAKYDAGLNEIYEQWLATDMSTDMRDRLRTSLENRLIDNLWQWRA